MPLTTLDISENALFKKTLTSTVHRLFQVFEDNDHILRIAGGAVRDILLGVEPQDLDFATDATPEQMKNFLHRAEIVTIRDDGDRLGMVTVRLEHLNYEISTLRANSVYDPQGEIEFVTDWEADAWRRDLTVNALFLDNHGTVFDYVGGLEDIAKRQIVFVGDPVEKIRQDARHILRYFRFFGRLADETTKHEQTMLEAIRLTRDELETVSGSRAWAELRLLVTGPRADEVLQTMLECGLGPPLGLPAEVDIARFRRISKEHEGLLEPTTLIAALLETEEDAQRFAKRLMISNSEKKQLKSLIMRWKEASMNAENEDFWWRERVDAEQNPSRVSTIYVPGLEQLARSTLSKSKMESYWTRKVPGFPIKTKDLLDAGIEKKFFEKTIKHVFQLWKESDCALMKDELLDRVKDVLQ